jgi:hypothetical protein
MRDTAGPSVRRARSVRSGHNGLDLYGNAGASKIADSHKCAGERSESGRFDVMDLGVGAFDAHLVQAKDAVRFALNL